MATKNELIKDVNIELYRLGFDCFLTGYWQNKIKRLKSERLKQWSLEFKETLARDHNRICEIMLRFSDEVAEAWKSYLLKKEENHAHKSVSD